MNKAHGVTKLKENNQRTILNIFYNSDVLFWFSIARPQFEEM